MKLKEIYITANTGLDAIKRAPILDYETSLRCIRIQDISQSKDFEEWGYTETTINDYKKFKLKKNDILIARTGATVGVTYIVKKDCEAVFNNGTIRLRLKPNANPNFIFHIFQTKEFKQYIENISCVSTQPNLKVENLLRFEIPNYDRIYQDKIANILDKYDELIDNNNKRIKLLKQITKEIYKEWFVRFRFPGYENSEFYEGFPKGWKIKKYNEELNIVYGKGLPIDKLKEEGYPVFGSNGQIGFYDKYMYEKPQILISCRGASSGIINISLPKSFITSNSLVCEIDERTESIFEYLKYYFKNTNLIQFQTGSAQPQITINNIKGMKMLIPPIELQKKFSEIIKPIDEEILNLFNQNENLIKQRDLLLPRLMSGKLGVK